MSNSRLIDYIKISPNSSNPRNNTINKITIHHMAGNLSVESCGEVFADISHQASSNYAIDSNGRIGMYVEEKNRAWTSSSSDNDNQAVTIEVANDTLGGDWHVSDIALEKLIELCIDICIRNNINKLNYTGDSKGNLTMHCYFAKTVCPGEYLKSKFPYIAKKVNKKLESIYKNNTPDLWAEKSVAWSIENKILFGDEYGNYKLHDYCTRQEMIVFIYRMYKNIKKCKKEI
ncbi:MAG: N-acetylmuramoyl-L-alanine amidase [Ruminococcaceae bacterium]|nr:N-acetylmuramoyl-L-alanine amidase [Oscillospiraceae bacterium]